MDKYIRNAWSNIRNVLAEDRNVSVVEHAGNVVLLAKNLNDLQRSSGCLHDVTKKNGMDLKMYQRLRDKEN